MGIDVAQREARIQCIVLLKQRRFAIKVIALLLGSE